MKLFISFLIFTISIPVYSQDSCPRTNNDILAFKKRIESLVLVKKGLDEFLSGRVVQSRPLTTIFVVNLEDNIEIVKRQKELSAYLSKKNITPSCENKEIDKVVKKLQSLEIEVSKQRFDFLSLPEKQRAALIALQKEVARNQTELESLREVGEKAEEKIEQTELAIRNAEDLSLSSKSAFLRTLAAEIATIERFRKNVAEKVSELTRKMESLRDDYHNQTEALGELSSILSKSEATTREINEAYQKVAIKWRVIVEDVVVAKSFLTEDLELKLPKSQEDILSRSEPAGYQEEIKKYRNSYELARSEISALKNLIIKFSASAREQRYRELVVTGQIRSQLLRMLETRGDTAPFKISNDYVKDLVREIKLVPYRPKALFISALNRVKERASSGIEGLLELLRSFFILGFFIFIPIFSIVLLKKILNTIETSRRKLIRRKSSKASTKILTWLHWARPYIPWIVMLLALKVSSITVENTDLDWLSEMLPYFSYYFIYKLFRVFIDNNLFAINRISQNKLTTELQIRVEKTSKYLGIFFLLSLYLLETTATVARRALFYRMVWDVLFFLTPVVLSFAAFAWRKEITNALKQTLSPSLYGKVSKYLNGPLALAFSLPAAFFLVLAMAMQRLKNELLEVDTVKSISAQLFRKKIESNIEEITDLEKSVIDKSYNDLFASGALESEELYVEASNSKTLIEDIVNKWLNGESEERSIAIYGEKGIGKSSILNLISVDCDVVRVSMDDKITTEEELVTFLNDQCSLNIKGENDISDELHSIDNALATKKVIIIDNAQSLFLSHRKGFDAYRAFISLLTLKTSNIFWCVSFNHYSWLYLNAINNGSQYFRHVFKIASWDDESIKALILKRHKSEFFQLEFNPIIYSLSSSNNRDDFQYVQDRFFELLWEQSKGNPRTALALWLSSLSAVGKKKLRVGLPGGQLSQKIDGLNDEELFVIASIVRHECLTTNEATLVTGLDGNNVQHVMRIGVERGFLVRDSEGSYRVTAIWQPIVIRELVGKNLLYG